MSPSQRHTGVQVLLPRGSQFRGPLTGHCSEPLFSRSGSCSFGTPYLAEAVGQGLGQFRLARRHGKVFLAMGWHSAYDQPCLVNRLWVPSTVRSLDLPDSGKLHGDSQIFGGYLGFRCAGSDLTGGLNPPRASECVANSGKGE